MINSQNLGKIPPQATDIEETVLGAILIESSAFARVSEMLKPESFYVPAHSKIYKAVCSLFAKSSAIDMMTVIAELKLQGSLEEIGGMFFITQLANRVANSANIVDHAKIIEQKFIQREVIRVCSETLRGAYDDTTDIFELIEAHQGEIYNSVKNTYGRNDVHISEAVKGRLHEYQKQCVEGLTGVGTGFTDLNRLTNGWQNTDLIIIAARPAMGKTAFVLETAKSAAIMHNVPVGIFSLEMSQEQLTDRMISSETGVYQDKIKKRNLTEYDWLQFHSKLGPLVDSNIYIDDTPGISITSLRSKAIRMKERYGIGLIVIDYLQLMEGPKDKRGNREQEIGSISRGLKVIAKDLGIPVIALSQLSRKVEDRPGINGKRPLLSDLRESGSIEQDADQVAFLYRPEYYGYDQDEEGRSTSGLVEVIFGKNRNGICDTVPLRFNGALMKFLDI